jgi:hypothetical protein
MLIWYLNAWSVSRMPSFTPRPGGAPSIHVAALAAAANLDDAGADDVVWPLDSSSAAAFAAAKLTDLALSRQLSPDDLRAIAMQLMRCGPPVGWLGALLLVEGQRGRR